MAILFPAAGSLVTRSGAYLSMAADFTVVGWVRNVTTDTPVGNYRTYWLLGDPTYASSVIAIFSGMSTDRSIYMDVWDGATDHFSDHSYPQPIDTWLALALTYEASPHTLTLWVGGVIAGVLTIDLSGVVFGVTTEQLGTDVASWPDIGAGYWLVAQRLYTEAELVAQWGSATAVSATNLLAFTPLTDPTMLQDDSGNGRDWTAAGPALTQLNILPIPPTLPFTANFQFTAPQAADSAVLVPDAVAYNNSPWVTLINVTAADIAVTGVVIKTDALNTYVNCEFDLGVGTGGPISPVTTFTGSWASTFYDSPGVLPHVVPLDILTGVTVSARMRKSNTTVAPWGIKLQYFSRPIVGSLTTTSKPQRCYPSAAPPTTLTIGASAWADSTRTEIIAATDADWILTGLVPNVVSLNIAWEVDLDIGPPGSETTLTTIRFHHTGIATTDGPGLMPNYRPLATIPIGSRLSAVTRRSPAVGASSITLKLSYFRGPL